jgi:hypothetical protein
MKKKKKILSITSSVVAQVALVALAACGATSETNDDEAENEPPPPNEEEIRSAVSCTEKAVTGYNAGSAYAMKVITVGGKSTSKATAHAFLKMQAAADAAGVNVTINSGFRSMDEQRYLYSCYQTRRCNNGNLAARPGYSNHQNGRALDLATNNWTWVRNNAGRFGFRATVPSERWHYEYSGADPGGPCARSGGGGGGGGTPPAGGGGGGGDDDPNPADDPPAPVSGCNSATLDRVVPEGACVQAESNGLFYQCKSGLWYRGVSNGRGPHGVCTETHPR